MKVLHVVPLISEDGAYGGPVAVASSQLQGLSDRGHEVELIAGGRGLTDLQATRMTGSPTRLFAVHSLAGRLGFAGLFSPSLLWFVLRNCRSFDRVHIHMARDLLSLPAAALALLMGAIVVIQPHGMVDRSERRLAGILDGLLTRRALRSARAVLVLTDTEFEDLHGVIGSTLNLIRINNGVSAQGDVARGPDEQPEVLFLARLHERKRPVVFAQVAVDLVSEFPHCRFALVGPDEGEGAAVSALLADEGDNVVWEGPLPPDEVLIRMRRATIFVLPSVGEVFPMSVLEAMSVGCAVVMTTSSGLAAQVGAHRAALVVEPDRVSLRDAVRSLLLDDDLRLRTASAGLRFSRDVVSQDQMTESLLSIYSSALKTG